MHISGLGQKLNRSKTIRTSLAILLLLVGFTISVVSFSGPHDPVVQPNQIQSIEVEKCSEYSVNLNSRFAGECDLEWLILEKAKEKGLRPTLVLEIIKRESGFRQRVCHNQIQCSKGGGLMQIIPSTLEECERQLGRALDALDPEDNLDCGLHLLKKDGIRHWEAWSGPYKISD